MEKRPEAKCVICDGPNAAQNGSGDEVPEWVVYFGDDDGEECGDPGSFSYFSVFQSAYEFAASLARRFHLEFINEAMEA